MAAKSKVSLLAAILLMAALAMPAFAGGGGGGGGAGGGGGGRGGRAGRAGAPGGGAPGAGGPGARGPGGGGPAAQLTQIQTTLGLDAAETTISPKITTVLEDLVVVQSGAGTLFARGGGRGGRGGGAAPAAPANEVATALADLNTTTAAADSTPDAIKAKVDAFRAAVKTASDKLTKDRADLKAAVNPKQEAQLIGLGVLN